MDSDAPLNTTAAYHALVTWARDDVPKDKGEIYGRIESIVPALAEWAQQYDTKWDGRCSANDVWAMLYILKDVHARARDLVEGAGEAHPDDRSLVVSNFVDTCLALDDAVVRGATKALRRTHASVPAHVVDPVSILAMAEKARPLRLLFEEAFNGASLKGDGEEGAEAHILEASEDPAAAIIGDPRYNPHKDLDGSPEDVSDLGYAGGGGGRPMGSRNGKGKEKACY